MSENLHELFQTAAKYFFSKYKENGGSLGKLALQLGTSHTYVSAVINGSRTASLDLQNQIANSLYGPFDRFITAGRHIKMGLKPDDNAHDKPRDDIENLMAQLTHYVMHHKNEKKKLEKVIEEQHWLFEAAVDSIEHVALVITDKNRNVLKWNACYQELMGYPDEVLETRSLSKYFQYLEDKLSDPEAFYKSIEKAKNSSEKTSHVFNLKDGRSIKRVVYPMFRDGILSGRIAHLTEVTEKSD